MKLRLCYLLLSAETGVGEGRDMTIASFISASLCISAVIQKYLALCASIFKLTPSKAIIVAIWRH